MLLIAGIVTLLVSLLPVRDIWALRQPRLSIRFALPALIATTIIGCGVSAGLTIKYGAGIADLAAAAAVFGAGCLVWITARIGKVALREALRMTALERHRADHDTLTSLPNRAFFLQQLERAISRAAGQHRLAVLIMDLNRFKLINDTLGHFYGDTVLQEVGRRLQSRLRVNDLVARLGGDEFVVLIDPVEHTEQAGTIAQDIASILEHPIVVAGYSADASASSGVAGYPEHGGSGNTLMKNAEIAMYEAKRRGVDTLVYDPGFDMHDVNRLTVLSQLRSAIEDHQLQVYYQPQFSAASGRLVGVEALVRWPHSDPAWPLPAEFIELAEQGGLIDRLNRWVLEIVFDQLAAWQEAGVTTTISTNLSAINLQDPELFTYIAHGLAARGLNAARLSLEITETAVASDTKAARAVVKRLSEFGVRLSIDDFGTGYSSLIILRELPVEEIKIDRSFVINMTRDSNDAILVRSTIDLAHKLGRAVTAEGVESREALELLKSWGCDVMQGFFLSPPLAIEDLNRKLADATWHPLTSAPAN